MIISACRARDFTKAMPAADFRSTAMDDFHLVKRSEVGGGRFAGDWEWVLPGIARSIRKTEAPLSARRRPAKGPESLD